MAEASLSVVLVPAPPLLPFNLFSSLPDDLFIEISSFLSMLDRPRLNNVSVDFNTRIKQKSDVIYAIGLTNVCGPLLTLNWPMNLKLPYRKMFTSESFYEAICESRYGYEEKEKLRRKLMEYPPKIAELGERWLTDYTFLVETRDFFGSVDGLNGLQQMIWGKSPFLCDELAGCPIKVCPACMSAEERRPDFFVTLSMEARERAAGNSGIEMKLDGQLLDAKEEEFRLRYQPGDLLLSGANLSLGKHEVTLECLTKCGFSGRFAFEVKARDDRLACHFFQRGRCNRGEACKFAHTLGGYTGWEEGGRGGRGRNRGGRGRGGRGGGTTWWDGFY